ncbi:MAG: FAD-dependent thymidylate synthase [Candidatus Aenigmarchaeota archaeon]|nr:FAD-dependent thymidylate synthase [Candidatus Aenigmarchaeota archaeon]
MFTEEQIRTLSKFMTNTDKPIFALKNLPEVVKGAMFSRYSRTSKSLRELLLSEFLQNQDISTMDLEGIPTKKAEEFYDRVLVEYGDDSVAELGGAHIACEGVSMIATKILEDARIGLSPLEKSTRYVFFNEKQDGRYKFCRETSIMSSEFAGLYEETCNMLFDMYSELIEPMKAYIISIFPKPADMTDRAYDFTVRAKACDVLRVFLPASTLTNMGIYGNGRAFEYLITKMYASPMQEIQHIAKSMQEELGKIIPSFVKRADDAYGRTMQEYMKQTETSTRSLVSSLAKSNGTESEEVILASFDKNAEEKIIAAILYSHSQISMTESLQLSHSMSLDNKAKVIEEYTRQRSNRRHRPGRAFENAYYTFDILGNYGIYRDLHRHRALTQQRQILTTELGYDIPKELVAVGAAEKYHDAMRKAGEAWKKISAKMPWQAQYVVPFGYRIRWYFTLNARELYHLLELRTVKQGHPDYRRICQKMYVLAKAAHPAVFKNMRFVDMNNYEMQRDEAEKRIDRKMEDVRKKYGS